MVKTALERIAVLEEQHDNFKEALETLTRAVNRLTTVLENGKGALKLLAVIITGISLLTSILTWAVAHVTL